ncbi:hypothetical protein BC826DRAFT_330822 [Russula brevipes]|nr:hypothetical protein BC826DRAFT_330822 [Russula brevipes]
MADKFYEFLSWPAKEDYLKDPTSFNERTFTYAVNRKGVHTLLHGPEEGGSRLGIAVAWETVDDFKTLVANATGELTKLREHFALSRSTTGPEDVFKVTVKFTADPLPALQSPVTELLYATLKPGADLQALAQTVGKAVIGSNSPASPAVAAAQGSVTDNPETIVLVIGWNSYEVGPSPAQSSYVYIWLNRHFLCRIS